ncbi:hypothetical protein COOONC_24142, partial [Cooperia oncophora]
LQVSVLISSILWECKAARLAVLQCTRPGKRTPHVSPVKEGIDVPEIKALGNSTAYSIGTKESESTIYATAFPVEKLDSSLTLSEVSLKLDGSSFQCFFPFWILLDFAELNSYLWIQSSKVSPRLKSKPFFAELPPNHSFRSFTYHCYFTS